MRRLTHHQQVEIHLDSDDLAISCRVASVQGGVATLTRAYELSSELVDKLTPGAFGYLLFEDRASMTALKGIATISPTEPSELAFVVIDGVQLPERRLSERVHLGALARISPADGGPGGIEVTAANVSAGGVLIERHAGLGDGPTFRLELVLSDGSDPIRCKAMIARETPTHVALKFVGIADPDRIRLAGMIREQALGVG